MTKLPTLKITGLPFILPTPVHDGYDHICTMQFSGRCDVSLYLLVLAPSHTGRVVTGLKTARVKFVVAQYSDTQAVPLEHQRRFFLA